MPQPSTDTDEPEPTGVGNTPSGGFPTIVPSCTGPSGEETTCSDTDSPSPTDTSSPSPTTGGAEGQTDLSPQPDTSRPGPTPPASGTP
ncbi:hypothetical protein ACH4GK_27705 [Streptomyces rimosus]|uniref:hypothetical protein n=1 Tax=Streptomyces rimosus TaxID=1927 RepID=UPI00131C2D68|nr:hypothetical protein [Streptomyces rimosus]